MNSQYLPQFVKIFHMIDSIFLKHFFFFMNDVFILKSYFVSRVVSALAAVPDIFWLNGPIWLIV